MKVSQKSITSSSVAIEFIKAEIISGQFQCGNRLPPVRELAKMIGVSSYPVQVATRELSKIGIVDTVRGSGVCVTKDALAKLSVDFPLKRKKRNIAVLSTFLRHDSGVAIEHGATVKGLLEECNAASFRVCLVSPYVDITNPKELLPELNEGEFDAVLWLYPVKKHFRAIKAVAKAKIPQVITSHEPFELELPTIEENILAVAKKIEKKLAEKSCKKVINIELQDSLVLMKEISTVYKSSFEFEEVTISYGGDYYRKQLREKLSSCEPGCAIFLSNNRDLRAYYSDEPEELVSLLKKHVAVVSTEESVFDNIKPLLEQINALVVLNKYQAIGRLAIQKVSVVLDGKLENTNSLVPVQLIDMSKNKH